MRLRIVEQFNHDKALLAADNTSLRNELVRAQTDLTFLSGAVREMVEHDGRISRTRLSEAVRICEQVDVKDAQVLGSSRLRRPGTPVPGSAKSAAASPARRFQVGAGTPTARNRHGSINGGSPAAGSRVALLMDTSAGGGMQRAMNGGSPHRASQGPAPSVATNGGHGPSAQGNGW